MNTEPNHPAPEAKAASGHTPMTTFRDRMRRRRERRKAEVAAGLRHSVHERTVDCLSREAVELENMRSLRVAQDGSFFHDQSANPFAEGRAS
jgi:hypothetical protein